MESDRKKSAYASISHVLVSTNRGGGTCLCKTVSDFYFLDVPKGACNFGLLNSNHTIRMFHASSSVLARRRNEEAPGLRPKKQQHVKKEIGPNPLLTRHTYLRDKI